MTDRAIPLCLLRVLRDHSDEKHILSIADIQKHLEAYDLHPDRRTLYTHFDVLTAMGYEISDFKANGKGYYLMSREVEPSEAHLLCDAVCALPFIPEKQTLDLIRKLQSLVSVYERRHIHNLTVDRSEQKTANKQIFYSIEMLDEAIEKGVKVQFNYCSYNEDKQLVPRRSSPYTVSPYGMVYSNEHYYLIARMEGKEKPGPWRIDRILDIDLTDEPREPWEGEESVRDLVRHSVKAHVGEVETVDLLVDRRALNDVIDEFGTDITIGEWPEDAGREPEHRRLHVTVRVCPSGMKYWALQFLAHVEVLSPESLRQEIADIIRKSPYSR